MIGVTATRGLAPESSGMTTDRVRTKIPVDFKAGAFKGTGEVRNVSEGGLFVGTLAIPEEGTELELNLREPGKAEIEVRGLVWWTAPAGQARRSGFGLRILDDHEAYRTLVQSVR